jgi:hypothetical protein
MKREREDSEHCDGEGPAKVRRLTKVDRVSKFSDELLVRILSFVPVEALLACQKYQHVILCMLCTTLTTPEYPKSSVALP